MILPFAVYILKCSDDRYYCGFTRNIRKRLQAHQSGQVSFTKNTLPIKLVHLSLFEDAKKAYDYERYLKSGSGMAFRNKRLV